MNEQENKRDRVDNRAKYVKRIVEAVKNMGCKDDHEDVWSILSEFQRENRDIINRQKAVIEVLREDNHIISNGYESLKAENEALKLINSTYVVETQRVRDIAIKEFAERFSEKLGKSKEIINICVDGVYESLADIINNLVKEMTEEKE